MASKEALEGLIDSKILRVLRLFFSNREKQFYLSEISIESEVPAATTIRVLGRLISLGIVKLIQIRKFKLYQLEENEKTRLLQSIVGGKK